jgi:CBS-domain-containing membrane protein
MASFGASCVILFAVSQSPLAQPRNVIFGHLISAFIGLLFLKLLGDSVFVIAFSVGCAIAAMQFLRCVHPPAGANPLVILLTANQINYDFSFLLFPVLSGSIALVIIAYIVNNLIGKSKWPIYWFALFRNKKL